MLVAMLGQLGVVAVVSVNSQQQILHVRNEKSVYERVFYSVRNVMCAMGCRFVIEHTQASTCTEGAFNAVLKKKTKNTVLKKNKKM